MTEKLLGNIVNVNMIQILQSNRLMPQNNRNKLKFIIKTKFI